MTDRPILFSAPMVRALLHGTKTQTRRVVKAPRSSHIDGRVFTAAVGDRLWVREACVTMAAADGGPDRRVAYAADGEPAFGAKGQYGHWILTSRVSIHMPRWASRLTLTVTDVRVQRLQGISEEDAIAEGILRGDPLPDIPSSAGVIWSGGVGDLGSEFAWTRSPIEAYRDLWDSINAARGFGWAANPYVVALTFTVAIDAAR